MDKIWAAPRVTAYEPYWFDLNPEYNGTSNKFRYAVYYKNTRGRTVKCRSFFSKQGASQCAKRFNAKPGIG